MEIDINDLKREQCHFRTSKRFTALV